jgi:hypothetical protein
MDSIIRKVPTDWPEEFIYILESFSADLHPMILKNLLFAAGVDQELVVPLIDEKKVHPHLVIKKLAARHPLSGQRGVFATEGICAGTDLGEYVGQIRLIDAAWPLDPTECDYSWTLRMDRFFFIIDAQKWANELAFVNDYRGVASKPNIAPKWVVHRSSYHLVFHTISPIAQNEEILIDYGADYWKAPHRI